MTTEFPCNNYSTYNEFEDLFKDIRAQNNYKYIKVRHTDPNKLTKTDLVEIGAFSKQETMFVISWNPILGTSIGGQGPGYPFHFTIVRKSTVSYETLPDLWRLLGWSFNVLLTGIISDMSAIAPGSGASAPDPCAIAPRVWCNCTQVGC